MNTQTQNVSKLVEAICAKDYVTADKFFSDLMRSNILEAIKIQESEELQHIGSSLFLEEAEEETEDDDADALAKIDAEIAALAGKSEEKVGEPKEDEPKEDAGEGTAEITHEGDDVHLELDIENDEAIIDKILKAAGIDEDDVTSDEDDETDEDDDETDEDDSEDDDTEETEEDDSADEPKEDEPKADAEKKDESIKWFDGGNPAAGELKTESVSRVSLFKKH